MNMNDIDRVVRRAIVMRGGAHIGEHTASSSMEDSTFYGVHVPYVEMCSCGALRYSTDGDWREPT